MSDTPANQKQYPQHSNQLVGCGFPLAKLVVWFCVTTGAVLEVAIAAFTTSEWEMARQMYATLQPDDVVVADSAYGTYVDLALVRNTVQLVPQHLSEIPPTPLNTRGAIEISFPPFISTVYTQVDSEPVSIPKRWIQTDLVREQG